MNSETKTSLNAVGRDITCPLCVDVDTSSQVVIVLMRFLMRLLIAEFGFVLQQLRHAGA